MFLWIRCSLVKALIITSIITHTSFRSLEENSNIYSLFYLNSMSLLSSLSLYCLINMTITSYIKKCTDNIEDCFYIYLINDKHLKTKSSLLKPKSN